MRKYEHLKEKALQFRKSGLTLEEIQKRLLLPKTTIYYWIKNIPIERTEKQSKALKLAVVAMKEKYATIRNNAYKIASENAEEKLKNPLFRDFIIIYLTEGFRKTRNIVSIANSNPAIIKVSNYWIKNLSSKNVGYCLQYHTDQSSKNLVRFWSKLVGCNIDKIKLQRKSNSGKLNGRSWRSPHGVLTVRVGDTELRSKIQAWMDHLEEIYNGV
jgi:hypothetical protein